MAVVGIPSIGLSDRLGPLVASLLDVEAVSLVAVYVNVANSVDRVAEHLDAAGILGHDRLELFCRYGRGIYHIWNLIIEEAAAAGELAVVLNDDIRIDPSSIRIVEGMFADPKAKAGIVGWDPDAAVEPYPHALPIPVRGTYREGGITGFAWAIDPALGVRCDEGFGWWGGDDDLVWSVQKAGGRAFKMSGLGVDHAASTSSSQRPEVLASLDADRNRLLYKWKRAW